ncbi:glycosyltransferase [Amycolatopsis samaneae]|uniref:Glycosyltransferase n=1 Tax=Amycolatopsis samaneae TaxID=664691 RepID=A0ABW5GS79_9PSEU
MEKQWQLLALEFDQCVRDARSDEEIAAGIAQESPLWLRISNFFQRHLSVLRHLPPGQLILWKLEHWGNSTPFDRVPASPDAIPANYTKELLDLGHHIHPYTFTERNVELLHGDVPPLGELDFGIVPIAQKVPAENASRAMIRDSLNLGPADTLLGVGGMLHPAKGIDEIAEWFLRTVPDPGVHLLCCVIPTEGETEEELRRRWERAAGVDSSDRIHLHLGKYRQWEWMCSFYQALDVMLVNSVSDSWGRMLSEAVGAGVPTLVRRAECATNEIFPDLVIVDDYRSLSYEEFRAFADTARERAPRLARYADTHYSVPVVEKKFLEMLRVRTPSERLAEFDRLAAQPRSRGLVQSMIDR